MAASWHSQTPLEQTVPGLPEQSLTVRHSTHSPLATSHTGLGNAQSGFDWQPVLLPPVPLVVVSPPLPPEPPLPPVPAPPPLPGPAVLVVVAGGSRWMESAHPAAPI